MKGWLWFVLGCAAVAPGCDEYKVRYHENPIDGWAGGPTPDPCITVDPHSIDFGEVLVGETSAEVDVLVSNTGKADLQLYDVELQNPDYPFELAPIDTPLVLPEEQVVLTVVFAPVTGASFQTRILIDSNDPETPTALVDLFGEALFP